MVRNVQASTRIERFVRWQTPSLLSLAPSSSELNNVVKSQCGVVKPLRISVVQLTVSCAVPFVVVAGRSSCVVLNVPMMSHDVHVTHGEGANVVVQVVLVAVKAAVVVVRILVSPAATIVDRAVVAVAVIVQAVRVVALVDDRMESLAATIMDHDGAVIVVNVRAATDPDVRVAAVLPSPAATIKDHTHVVGDIQACASIVAVAPVATRTRRPVVLVVEVVNVARIRMPSPAAMHPDRDDDHAHMASHATMDQDREDDHQEQSPVVMHLDKDDDHQEESHVAMDPDGAETNRAVMVSVVAVAARLTADEVTADHPNAATKLVEAALVHVEAHLVSVDVAVVGVADHAVVRVATRSPLPLHSSLHLASTVMHSLKRIWHSGMVSLPSWRFKRMESDAEVVCVTRPDASSNTNRRSCKRHREMWHGSCIQQQREVMQHAHAEDCPHVKSVNKLAHWPHGVVRLVRLHSTRFSFISYVDVRMLLRAVVMARVLLGRHNKRHRMMEVARMDVEAAAVVAVMVEETAVTMVVGMATVAVMAMAVEMVTTMVAVMVEVVIMVVIVATMARVVMSPEATAARVVPQEEPISTMGQNRCSSQTILRWEQQVR